MKIFVGVFILFAVISTAVSVAVLETVFVLFSAPEATAVFPAERSRDIPLDRQIAVNFSKPIKRQGVKILIYPQTEGEIRFENSLVPRHLYKKMIFTPVFGLEPDTEYFVEIKEIKGFGLDKAASFSFNFKTAPGAAKSGIGEVMGAEGSVEPGGKGALLDIALDWQDHPLSCEAASLKMALAGKGIKITEGEIMEEIGFDPTLHEQSIWGDPYRAFVGDIDGKMCSTGYGVYWEPTAEAALKWRPAEFFSDWSLDNLIREIKSGNPVVVWGKLDVEQLTDCSWFTSEGKYIKAYKETHVRLVVGFTGPAENPENIIINDPLAGRLYWPTSYFLENWKVFGNSGVVVR